MHGVCPYGKANLNGVPVYFFLRKTTGGAYSVFMTDLSPIVALIQDAKTQLAKLEERASMLRAQIDAYEKTLRAMGGAETSLVATALPKAALRVSRTEIKVRKRKFDDKWASVIDFIDRHVEGVGSDEIFEFASSIPEMGDLNRDRLRSQLHNFTLSGVLERVSQGVFKLTENGRRLVESSKIENLI